MSYRPQTPEQIQAQNQYHAYMNGWRAGATGSAMNPAYKRGYGEKWRVEYESGFADGYDARKKAFAHCRKTFCYEPRIIRTAKPLPRRTRKARGL
jgi:hypothetical protein